MKSMKLILENWNRYIEQEEKQETIEEGIFKNLALALGLMMGGPAMGSTPTPEPATATQVVKSGDKEIDQTLQQLSEIARDIHLSISANSFGAARDKVQEFKEVSSKLTDKGVNMTDLTKLNATIGKLVYDAAAASVFKGSDPNKYWDLFGAAVGGLKDVARQVEELSANYTVP